MTSLVTSKSDVAELLTIASTLVSQNIWGRNQRAALKELLLSGDPRTARVAKLASTAGGDPSFVEPIYEALDDLVFGEVASVLSQMGYRLTAGTDSVANGGTSQVSRSFEELSLADMMSSAAEAEETTTVETTKLRNTWFGAVVAGMSQARPMPSGGKCCCIGSGAGLLAFAAVFFADFGTVVGVESNHDLHERAVNTHHLFEREFRERTMDTSAPRPVELIFYHKGCASPDTLHELRQADVILVDGTRVDSPHSLAAASADSCRPGTIVVTLDISFPESDFEMLHSEEFSTLDWGAPSVTVRVQRRKGLNREKDPSSNSNSAATNSAATNSAATNSTATTTSPFSFQTIDTSSSLRSPYVSTSPQRMRPSSPPLAIPGSIPMTTPQRLARNEAQAHVSSPIGSSLLEAKQRQAGRSKQLSPGWQDNSSRLVREGGGGTTRTSSSRDGVRTPERPATLATRLSGSYEGGAGGSAFGSFSSSMEASSPIGASLMMRKMRDGGRGGGGGGGGGGPLGMPSFSPKTGSPLSDSVLLGRSLPSSQPSSPMGAALLRRKQSGTTTTRGGGPIMLGGRTTSGGHEFLRSSTGGGGSGGGSGSSPLRRVIQHPVIPEGIGGAGRSALTEEEEAPSSPMSTALLRKKRLRQQERSSPLRKTSGGGTSGGGTSGGRTTSGGTSPTFRNLIETGFFDDDE